MSNELFIQVIIYIYIYIYIYIFIYMYIFFFPNLVSRFAGGVIRGTLLKSL